MPTLTGFGTGHQLLEIVMSLALGFSLSVGARGGGVVQAPVVFGPVGFSVGARTLLGVALGLGSRSAGAVSGGATVLALGTRVAGGDHFAALGSGIVTTAPPVDALYTYTGCTLSNAQGSSDPFTLNISTVAGAYTFTSVAGFDAALADDAGAGSDFLPAEGMSIHVIGAAGQSNMVGSGADDGGAGHPAGVYEWGRNGADDGVIVPAQAPLQHNDIYAAGNMGLDTGFSIAYRAANPNAVLIFVPAARGGTDFHSGDWAGGGANYADFEARANAVLAQLSEADFTAIIWHQGENSRHDTGGLASYQADLEGFISSIRDGIAGASDTTPFILGGLAPAFLANASPDPQFVQDAIDAVPGRIALTAVASASGLTAPDNTHFDGTSLRTLGGRYHAALATARVNTGTVPAFTGTPAITGTPQTGQVLSLVNTDASGPPTPTLTFQWKRDGADISGATSATYTPGTADDLASITCTITATNTAGAVEATTAGVAVTHPAPVAAGGTIDVELAIDAAANHDASQHFTGSGLVFAVQSGTLDAGLSLDPGTGAITGTPTIEGTDNPVTIRATNSGGTADQAILIDITSAPSQPIPVPVTFDGATDHLTRGAALAGASASQSVSGYFKYEMTGANLFLVDAADGSDIQIKVSNATQIVIQLAGSTLSSNAGFGPGSGEHEVWWSWDGAAGTGEIFVDGADEKTAGSGIIAGTAPFSSTSWTIAAKIDASKKWAGTLSRFTVWDDAVLDVTSASVRTGMADEAQAASLGTNIIDMYGAAADWNTGTNHGTGGSFTMNGSVV